MLELQAPLEIEELKTFSLNYHIFDFVLRWLVVFLCDCNVKRIVFIFINIVFSQTMDLIILQRCSAFVSLVSDFMFISLSFLSLSLLLNVYSFCTSMIES